MNRLRHLIGLLLVAFPLCNVNAQELEFYQNPVIRTDLADPSVIRFDGAYYVSGTSSEWAPFYPIYKSTDLVNWVQVGHVFEQKPDWTEGSFWAPELYVYNNKVYCYYSARRKSDHKSYIGVAVSNTPENVFEDKGPLVTIGSECIDAFVFNDNGQLYITWKAYGLDPRPIEILCCKLSSDGLHLEGEPFSLLTDEESIGMEGQCIIRKGDWYYLLYSARGCCGPGSDYEVRVARSKKMTESFQKYSDNPILMRSDDFQACGHGTVTTTPDGRSYYLCHSYQRDAKFYMGRQPIVQELMFGSDQWPHFKTGRLATSRQPMPFEGTKQGEWKQFADDFSSNKLGVSWTWNYTFCNVKTEINGNGKLLLSGKGIKEPNAAALCQRTPDADYCFAVNVLNNGQSMRGIALYGDAGNYVALVLRGKKLQTISKCNGKETILSELPMKRRNIRLQAEVKDCRTLSFMYDDGNGMKKLEPFSVDASHTTPWDRVARPGVISAVLANSKEKPAEFSDFKMWKR